MPRRRKLWQSLETVEPAPPVPPEASDAAPVRPVHPVREVSRAPQRDEAPRRAPSGDKFPPRADATHPPSAVNEDVRPAVPDDLDEAGEVKSPCTGLCAVTAAGRCPGCGRTLLEIASWTSLGAEGKRDVRRRAATRLGGSAQRS